MNERNSDWQYVATVAVGKNQLLMQQAIYSATVAVDIRRPHFGYRKCAFSVMLEWLEVETGISGKGAGVG